LERPLEKCENRFCLSKQLEKHWAPRRHYTQAASKCKFALVSGRSAGRPSAWGPISRNRPITGPAYINTWMSSTLKCKAKMKIFWHILTS